MWLYRRIHLILTFKNSGPVCDYKDFLHRNLGTYVYQSTLIDIGYHRYTMLFYVQLGSMGP